MSSVSSRLVAWKLEKLESIGVNIKPLLSDCNISEYEINNEHGRIQSESYFRLLNKTSIYNNEVFRNSDKPSDKRIDNLFFPLFGLCLNSPTAADAINNFLTYRKIMGDTDSIKAYYTDSGLTIEYETDPRCHSPSSSAEGNFLILNHIIRPYLNDSEMQVSASFLGKPTIDNELFCHALNAKPQYNQTKNQLTIKSNKLHKTSHSFNPHLYTLQLTNANQEINFTNKINEKTFANNIENIINNLIYAGNLDLEKNILDQVCNALKMSRWTLNKRLQVEQTSFSQILKDVRINISCDLLINTSKSIQEISDITHFSSIANFSRFFSTHMYHSPKKYRLINTRHLLSIVTCFVSSLLLNIKSDNFLAIIS
jgi:AraC-like DNA-binding protein